MAKRSAKVKKATAAVKATVKAATTAAATMRKANSKTESQGQNQGQEAAVQQPVVQQFEMSVCIIDGCSRPSHSRGLCHKHYQTAWNAVRSGRATWKRLESLGLAVKRSRKPSLFEVGVD